MFSYLCFNLSQSMSWLNHNGSVFGSINTLDILHGQRFTQMVNKWS